MVAGTGGLSREGAFEKPGALITLVALLLFYSAFIQLANAAESEGQLPPGLIARAQILISNGRANEAYRLLEPHEAAGASNLQYNYLLGVAALDSDHPSVAALALQRVLIEKPDYSAARMELGRAYYELGDYEGARREFEALKQDEPPPLAYTAIINYLSAINRESARYRPGINYYLQAGIGYDTNANGSTDADTFLNFRLDERNIAQETPYFEIDYGYSFHYPLSDRYQGIIEGDVRHRRNPDAEFVDMDRIKGGIGVNYYDGLLSMKTLVTAARTELESGYAWDGKFNNSDIGLETRLRRRLKTPEWFFVADGRIGRINYRQIIDVQDVDQVLASAGFEWSEGRYLYRRMGGVLILGKDSPREKDSRYGRNQLGFRLYGSRQINPELWFLAEGGVLLSDYDKKFFTMTRDDDHFSIITAVDWRPFKDPRLSLQPHVSYRNNKSKIELFDYDRVELGVAIRWVSG